MEQNETAPRRPPKKNILEAIKLLDQEAEKQRSRAVRSQDIVDNPPNAQCDPIYWKRDATAAIKKAQRLGLITEWLEAISNVE